MVTSYKFNNFTKKSTPKMYSTRLECEEHENAETSDREVVQTAKLQKLILVEIVGGLILRHHVMWFVSWIILNVSTRS